ncbi:HNH endonuclease [Halalkalibacter krulwichiae]|uniref:HNH endonuclease n=1 Tax=Halalkalibacter krulwichiae TaxID=199441 RepID=A0A1X9MKG0_9BACI|nr:HNH endonuclease signature motif containing protein [Halalkalibacter krulwichiae]ARK32141.1 HNH endonuclease [Halalkalibacter krulwichiae]
MVAKKRIGYYSNKRIGDKIYHTSTWRKLRRSYYGKKHGLCEQCGKPGDIVDHIEEITEENVNDPFVTFNEENLQLLCLSCHNTKTFKKHFATRDDVMFDEFGQLIKK